MERTRFPSQIKFEPDPFFSFWDQDVEGIALPNGTFSFEVYAKNLEKYYALYKDEIEEYIASVSGDIPEVLNTLKLQHFNHTGCI